MTITKKELIANVASNLDLTIKDTTIFIDCVLDSIVAELQCGNDVLITGFGKFTTSKRKARFIDSPIVDKEVFVPAKRYPRFKFAEVIKEAF